MIDIRQPTILKIFFGVFLFILFVIAPACASGTSDNDPPCLWHGTTAHCNEVYPAAVPSDTGDIFLFILSGSVSYYIPATQEKMAGTTYVQPKYPATWSLNKSTVQRVPSVSDNKGIIQQAPVVPVKPFKFTLPSNGTVTTTKSAITPVKPATGFPSQVWSQKTVPTTLKFPVPVTGTPILKPGTAFKLLVPTYSVPAVPAQNNPSISLVGNDTHEVEQRILYYTNMKRADWGKSPYAWDGNLAIIGRDDCVDMATRGFFDHINPDGETPTDRARRHGYPTEKDYGTYYRVGVGENIAMLSNYPGTPDDIARFIVDAWMESPGHRANILDTNDAGYTNIGVGVAYDKPSDTWYAAQEFF